jgi:iron(III) transport system permease protein
LDQLAHDPGVAASRVVQTARPPAVGVLRSGVLQERLVWSMVALAVVVLAIVPLAISLDTAFHAETRFGLSPLHSLAPFLYVYTSWDYWGALGQTVLLSGEVMVLSVVAGVAAAVLVARTNLPQKTLLDVLICMPLFISPFTGLIAWVALGSAKTGFINTGLQAVFGHLGIALPSIVNIWTFQGAAWVMFLSFMPFVYLFTVGSLRSMDGALEESARSVGAGPLQALLSVTIPLCMPSILVSSLIVFVLTAETYTIPGEIGTNAGFTVLSWQIFLDAAGTNVHQARAAAASTMLALVALAALLLQRWITRKSARYVTVTGKGFNGRLMTLGGWRWAAILFIAAYILCATLLPFAALLLSSFLRNSTAVLALNLFTLDHYRHFFNDRETLGSLVNTAFLAVAAAGLCVLAGFVISFADVRRGGVLPKCIAVLSALPVAVPGLVYGIGILWVSLKTPFYGTIWVLLCAYIAKFVPFGVVMSRGGLQQIHPDLEGSARMSGATPAQAVWHVTLPLMRLTLISAAFCVMLLCIKELSASVILYTARSEVLSVMTWHYMDSGNYQFAAAIGVIQTVMMVAIVFAMRAAFSIRLEQTMGRGGA